MPRTTSTVTAMIILVVLAAARRRWRPLLAASFVQPTCVQPPPQAQLRSARDTFAGSRRELGTLSRTIAGVLNVPGRA
jgi:hypothetical protein